MITPVAQRTIMVGVLDEYLRIIGDKDLGECAKYLVKGFIDLVNSCPYEVTDCQILNQMIVDASNKTSIFQLTETDFNDDLKWSSFPFYPYLSPKEDKNIDCFELSRTPHRIIKIRDKKSGVYRYFDFKYYDGFVDENKNIVKIDIAQSMIAYRVFNVVFKEIVLQDLPYDLMISRFAETNTGNADEQFAYDFFKNWADNNEDFFKKIASQLINK